MRYIASAMIFVVFNAVIVFLISDIFKSYISSNAILLFKIATCGSFGGFLSVSLNINKLNLDFDGSPAIQFFTGFSRIFISMISAIIMYYLIKSDIVLGLINYINNNNVFYALGIVSGFSETFVPNIIKSVEKD